VLAQESTMRALPTYTTVETKDTVTFEYMSNHLSKTKPRAAMALGL
jgi:hypothetical protein